MATLDNLCATPSTTWDAKPPYPPLPRFPYPLDCGAAHAVQAAVAAVKHRIPEVAAMPTATRLAVAEKCVDVISTGSGIMWATEQQQQKVARRRAKKPDDCDEYPVDEVAGALATGLAILAHRKPGVDFHGRHWCTAAHAGCGRHMDPDAGGDAPLPENAVRMVTGTWYTPRQIAENTVRHTMEPLVYHPGPLETADKTEWRLKTPPEIAELKTADIAVGAGAFAVAMVRYLAEHIVDTWRRWQPSTQDWEQLPDILCILHQAGWAEAHRPDVVFHRGTATVATPQPMRIARQLAIRCFYGVDIQPMSVQLCRTVLRLMIPLDDADPWIDRRIKCGDSLLGITSLDQIRHMHLHPDKGQALHEKPLFTDDEWARAIRPLEQLAEAARKGEI